MQTKKLTLSPEAEQHCYPKMKSILLLVALGALAVGVAIGYMGRIVVFENRMQKNFTSLSGESLSRLDELGRFSRSFTPIEIDERWKEHVAFVRATNDLNALRRAWTSWQSAIIYREAERIGWEKYRGVIAHQCAKYLATPSTKLSDFAAQESKLASDMIHEAILQGLLEKKPLLD